MTEQGHDSGPGSQTDPANEQAPAGRPGPAATEDRAAQTAPPLIPGARPPEPPGTGQPEGGAARTEGSDEGAELEQLRAEVRRLRERAGEPEPGTGGARHAGGGRWRAPVSVIAIVLGCLLAITSVLGVWAANQVSNTDRFVANMAPLIDQPPVQNALSAKITSQITTAADIPALTTTAANQLAQAHLPQLSNLVKNFSGPIASGVDSLVGSVVSRFVASAAMARLWVTALRTAHTGIVSVLSGQHGGTVDVSNGQVVLQLGPIITAAKKQLVANGLSFAANLPAVNPTFPLFEAQNLAKAQSGYRLLLTLKWVLPILSIVLLAAGVWVARGRRRALIGAALGLSGAMLVLAIALAIARGIYLNSVPQDVLRSDAASAAYDTLVRFIRDGLRALLLIGLVVAAGAFLTGPSAIAARTRRAVADGFDWVRNRGERAGLHAGPVGAWVAAHKTLLRAAAIGIVALIFVFWGQITLVLVIWLVVLLLVLLGIIELLSGGKRGRAAGPDAGAVA